MAINNRFCVKCDFEQTNKNNKTKIPIINANGNTPAVPTAFKNAKNMNELYVAETA